jgi:2,3-bisphosphoglycerate-independent phosphoglycerate mutase
MVQGAVMGLMFAATYWVFSWTVQLTQPKNTGTQATLARQQAEYDAATKKSTEIASEMIARSEAILAKQEAQAKRLDAVIAAWEKQAGIAK